MRTRRPFLLLLAASALVAAGCGSDSDGGGDPKANAGSSPSDAPALTTAALKKRVNAICRDAAEKAPEFPGERAGSGFKTTAADIIPYLEQISELNRQSLRELRALDPPKAQERQVATLMDAQRTRIAGLKDALEAAAAGDGAAFTAAFQRDQKVNGPAYVDAAEKLGVRACGG